MEHLDLLAAAALLYGNAKQYPDSDTIYIDDTPATITQMSAIKAQAEVTFHDYKSNEYKVLRKKAYDKLNQLELQYDDMVNGTNTWQEAIETIKAKYPKGYLE